MNFKETAENYNKNKRKMMTDAVINNKNYMRDFTQYHAESLKLMFAEWHLLFPNLKQDLNCTSCRGAVCKFWETMMGEWIEIESKPKKRNVTKKTKTK